MNYLFIIPRTLWKLLFILNFILGLIILYPLFFVFLAKKKDSYPKAFQLKKFWARWILTIPGLFYKIKYEIPADKLPQPAVYCANHASYLDIVYSYIAIPKYFVFMGKQELNRMHDLHNKLQVAVICRLEFHI